MSSSARCRDAEAAAPIMEAIQHIWRLSGSDTVDLLMAAPSASPRKTTSILR